MRDDIIVCVYVCACVCVFVGVCVARHLVVVPGIVTHQHIVHLSFLIGDLVYSTSSRQTHRPINPSTSSTVSRSSRINVVALLSSSLLLSLLLSLSLLLLLLLHGTWALLSYQFDEHRAVVHTL